MDSDLADGVDAVMRNADALRKLGVPDDMLNRETVEQILRANADERWTDLTEQVWEVAATMAAEVIDELAARDDQLRDRLNENGMLTGLPEDKQKELVDRLSDAISRHRPQGA